jgi:predicted RNA-binding protein with RPS1 domain
MELKKETELYGEHYWEILATKGRMVPNEKLSDKYGNKIYCHEPYAEELAKLYSSISDVANKEPAIGEVYKLLDVRVGRNNELQATLSGFIDAAINLEHEKKFIEMLNMNEDEFISMLSSEEGKYGFCKSEYHVRIESTHPYVKASLYEGQLSHIKEEFFQQISNPKTAYYGTITGKNQGGFIISVQGINGFLPGSLAAANVVRDFDSMIGKTVAVMVEDYLNESNTFVFSHKKYLNHILPSKIEALDLDAKYEGTITGIAKYGIFVEFDEIFTGLLHTSKMSPSIKDKFKNYEFQPGDTLEFWIREITPDKKIILSDEDPSYRRKELEDFKEQNLGIIRGGEVVSIQPFGALIKLQKDIVGLIAQKEIKSKKKRFNVGDTVMVTIDRVHNDKIFLSLPNES